MWEEVTLNIINNDMAISAVAANEKFTKHTKSNVYISTFIAVFLTQVVQRSISPSRQKNVVLRYRFHHILLSLGKYLIPPEMTGAMGLWSSETLVNDYFTEFVLASLKMYAPKSKSVGGYYQIQRVWTVFISRIRKYTILKHWKNKYWSRLWNRVLFYVWTSNSFRRWFPTTR